VNGKVHELVEVGIGYVLLPDKDQIVALVIV
jgi:hypothetical protein